MKAEVEFKVTIAADPDPEKAMSRAKETAKMLLSSLPGGGEGFKLSNVETFPNEEVAWEVYTFGGEKVLRGGDTWSCRLTYLAEVELR